MQSNNPNLIANPFTTLSSELIYDNPWISVTENKIIKPNGTPGIYGVAHFKNLAIGILPLDSEGYTYLVGQYRYTLNEYSWEIPEGGGKLDVDPLETAKKELREETGFSAREWTCLGKFHTSNSVTDELGYMFLAEDLQPGETDFDDTEVLQLKKVHLSEALHMVLESKITDLISVATILAVSRLKNIK
jgi:8-oxo-dGTP pyrophosphatase MutT (NUDIX family)